MAAGPKNLVSQVTQVGFGKIRGLFGTRWTLVQMLDNQTCLRHLREELMTQMRRG